MKDEVDKIFDVLMHGGNPSYSVDLSHSKAFRILGESSSIDEKDIKISGTPQVTEQDIIECLQTLNKQIDDGMFKGNLEPFHGLVDIMTAHMCFAEMFINHFEAVDPDKYKLLLDQLYGYFDRIESVRKKISEHMESIKF